MIEFILQSFTGPPPWVRHCSQPWVGFGGWWCRKLQRWLRWQSPAFEKLPITGSTNTAGGVWEALWTIHWERIHWFEWMKTSSEHLEGVFEVSGPVLHLAFEMALRDQWKDCCKWRGGVGGEERGLHTSSSEKLTVREGKQTQTPNHSATDRWCSKDFSLVEILAGSQLTHHFGEWHG